MIPQSSLLFRAPPSLATILTCLMQVLLFVYPCKMFIILMCGFFVFVFVLRYAGFSLLWPLPLRSTGSRRAGSAAMAHGPSPAAACGIFPDRARTRIPCIGRWTLNHCATREALPMRFDCDLKGDAEAHGVGSHPPRVIHSFHYLALLTNT